MKCQICGWGGQYIKPGCKTLAQAKRCDLNWENCRKYALRFQGEIKRGELAMPVLVKSIRHQAGPSGDKGDHSEWLVPVDPKTVRHLLLLSLVALPLFAVRPAQAAATECHARKGDRTVYWSWREVAGRRCWYVGHRGRDKRSLRWSAEVASRQSTPLVRNPVDAQDRRAEPAVGSTIIAERWPESDWNEFSRALFSQVAAVEALTPPDPPGALETTPLSSPPPPVPKPSNNTTTLPLVALAVGLSMLALGAFIVRTTTHTA